MSYKKTLSILHKAALLSVCGVCLSGCATLRAMDCNKDAAFSQGINDGRSGNPMDSDYASICQKNNAKLNKAYRRGYMKGMQNPIPRPSRIIIKEKVVKKKNR